MARSATLSQLNMFHQFNDIEIMEGENFSIPSFTIPNQAPTLKQLVLASLQGEPLPMTSCPMYDESDNFGEARLQSNDTPIEDTITMARNGQFDSKQEAESEAVEENEEQSDEVEEKAEETAS